MKRLDIKKNGLCSLSAIPVRRKPDHNSLLITQILFGESIEVLTIRDKYWIKVRCNFDHVIGWIDPNQISFYKDDVLPEVEYHVSLELVQAVFSKTNIVNVLIGSSLPRFDGISCHINTSKYRFSGQAISQPNGPIHAEMFLKVLLRFLRAPELYGGRTPFGIDAAAFVQLVYKIFYINLPRHITHQIDYGITILFQNEVLLGDIAFFEDRMGNITHAGIVISKKEIIHVYGEVRRDKFDHNGIFNLDERRYSHKLRIVKRIENLINFNNSNT